MELGWIHALVGDTAMATSALSCGTNDRDNNELKFLQEALRLVDNLLCWEFRDDFEFVTAENSRAGCGEHGGVEGGEGAQGVR